MNLNIEVMPYGLYSYLDNNYFIYLKLDKFNFYCTSIYIYIFLNSDILSISRSFFFSKPKTER